MDCGALLWARSAVNVDTKLKKDGTSEEGWNFIMDIMDMRLEEAIISLSVS